jgi:transcriptional regulator with XRE-family HTH domain
MAISENIRELRKLRGLTQSQLAAKIGVNRSVIGAYEEGRAEPRLDTITNLAHYFEVSLDELIMGGKGSGKVDTEGSNLRVIPITVDASTDRELITVVPEKARAGYLGGFGDLDFVESLPRFSLPLPELKQDRTYRAFQIEGDSMLPLLPGTYVLGQFVQNWNQVRNKEGYVVVTKDDGILYKRVENHLDSDDHFILKSDNKAYQDIVVSVAQVHEIWKAVGYISFQMPSQDLETATLGALSASISEIRDDVKALRDGH